MFPLFLLSQVWPDSFNLPDSFTYEPKYTPVWVRRVKTILMVCIGLIGIQSIYLESVHPNPTESLFPFSFLPHWKLEFRNSHPPMFLTSWSKKRKREITFRTVAWVISLEHGSPTQMGKVKLASVLFAQYKPLENRHSNIQLKNRKAYPGVVSANFFFKKKGKERQNR